MKPRFSMCFAAVALSTVLVVPVRLAAQDEQNSPRQVHYSVQNLGTLGGVFGSSAHSINDRSWVAGVANLTGDMVEHATLWRHGVITDLGTLGGSNSNVDFPAKNNAGLIVGFSQTATVDPLAENFCIFQCTASGGPCEGSDHSCRGFTWRNNIMKPLGTLGGNNSAALEVNNRGLVVGVAENNTPDPNCIPPQVLDYEAVTWQRGSIHQLPVFPGDADAAAVGVNDNDQIVGASGMCGSGIGISPIFVHAVLWYKDSVTDLGSLGGVVNNAAYGINNRGQVVGASDLPGDNTGHAFLWQKGAMKDLRTLEGDFSSAAFGINNKGQVVGLSCDQTGNCRAFLWQNGRITDLNALILPTSPLYLLVANDINSEGEIVGIALDQNSGAPVAFLAVPCDEEHGDQGCPDAARSPSGVERPRVVLPETVRERLRQGLGFGRFANNPPEGDFLNEHSRMNFGAIANSCVELGRSCTSSKQCCPGSFCGGHHTCCKLPFYGQYCTSSAQCCSRLCLNHRCS